METNPNGANKNEHGEWYNAHSKLCSKSNKKRKILTHHEIIDHIVQQILLVITQVCKESKLWIHLNLWGPSFSFTFSFKFTYLCIVDVWNSEKEFYLRK